MVTRNSASRQDLEAAIWRLLADHKATVPDALPFIESLLALADAYGSGDSEHLTALRREVLHRETAPNAQSSASERGGDR